MTFNGDPFFSLKVHIIQHLVHHLAFADRICHLQKAVSESGFPMIDMGDDAKIPDVLQ
jgi:hypothetical protein